MGGHLSLRTLSDNSNILRRCILGFSLCGRVQIEPRFNAFGKFVVGPSPDKYIVFGEFGFLLFVVQVDQGFLRLLLFLKILTRSGVFQFESFEFLKLILEQAGMHLLNKGRFGLFFAAHE
jgi:hypothetical protein